MLSSWLLIIFSILVALVGGFVFLVRREVERQNKALELSEQTAMKRYRKSVKNMKSVDLTTLNLPYTPWDTDSLLRFAPVKENTHCVFAKKSNLWATDDWKEGE